jgi:O-antigen/teichoic acid export membrane protein
MSENLSSSEKGCPKPPEGGQASAKPALSPGIVRILAGRFGYVLCAQWGSSLLTGVFLILLARSGPELFGFFTLAMALGALVNLATDAGLKDYLVPLMSERRAHMRRILARAVFLQTILLLASLAALALLSLYLEYGPQKSAVSLLVSAGMGLSTAMQSFFVLCRIRGRQDTEMRITVPASFAGSLFGIVCLLLQAPPALLACFKLVESTFMLILVGRALRWRLGAFPTGEICRVGEWRQGFSFTGIAVCGLLYNKLNMYVLDQHSGSYALGLYNAPWEIVDGLSVLISGALLAKVLFPHLAGQWQKDKAAFTHMCGIISGGLLLFGAVVTLILFFTGEKFLTLVYGADYLASAPLLYAQLPCLLASSLHNLAAYMLICMQRYRSLLLAYISGLACNMALCALCIPAHGAIGAAWAISGTKIWMAVCTVGLALLFLRTAHRPGR